MLAKRAGLALLIATLLVAVGFIAALAGGVLCSPPPLLGDELWTLQRGAFGALRLVLGAGRLPDDTACFQRDWFGQALIAASGYTPVAVGVVLGAFVIWVTAGRLVEEWWFRVKGNHTVYVAQPDAVLDYAGHNTGSRGRVMLAVDRGHEQRLQRRFWMSVIRRVPAGSPDAALRRLGADRARRVVIASGSDIQNAAIAEAMFRVAAVKGKGPEILLVLEDSGFRSLKASGLMRLAYAAGVNLVVVSLSQIQVRIGALTAIPFDFVPPTARRVHVVVCGSGPLLAPLALHLAAQAYWQGGARPLLTVAWFGEGRLADAVAGRLRRTGFAGELSLLSGDASDQAGFEQAMFGVGADRDPVAAIHCTGLDEAEVAALALRWEQAMRSPGPVPPIIAYPLRMPSRPDAIGTTGMVRWALPVPLGKSAGVAQALDTLAVVIHNDYRDKRLAEGGPLSPKALPWPELSAEVQDDNRRVADHQALKLALIGCGAASSPALPSTTMSRDEIELLAHFEHDRWTAARSIDGWSYSAKRDDDRRLHNNFVSWDELSEADRDKDRQSVRLIPELLRRSGKRLARDFGVFVPAGGMSEASRPSLLDRCLTWQIRHPDRRVLMWVDFADSGAVDLMEAAASRGVPTGLIDYAPPGTADVDEHARRVVAAVRSVERFAPFAGWADGQGTVHGDRRLSAAIVHPSALHRSPRGLPVAVVDSEGHWLDENWLAG